MRNNYKILFADVIVLRVSKPFYINQNQVRCTFFAYILGPYTCLVFCKASVR
jgi:hypothetical protein